jgi:hypothetical protein
MSKITTVQQHILDQERLYPRATGDFTALLTSLTVAAKIISREVNKAGLAKIIGETGETNINYREFRESFLESEQFKIVGTQKPDLGTLRKTLHELMTKSKYDDVISTAKKMLSIDYTDMEAHKILQQTYKILGDASNQAKYHDIEFGLLNSIVKRGDGKTCRTAWPLAKKSPAPSRQFASRSRLPRPHRFSTRRQRMSGVEKSSIFRFGFPPA